MPKILVVDDEQEIVQLLEEFLAKTGFEVITAPGGERAIEVIQSKEKIDLMILDIKMPKMTGVDVLKKIEQINRKIPVVVLSGSLDLERTGDDLKIMGYYNDVIYKPIDLFALLDMIKKKLPPQRG